MNATASISVALATSALSEGRSGLVHLLPIGAVKAADGRHWSLNDPAQFIARTKDHARGRPLAVDYEHQTELAVANGQAAPAAGWINDICERDGGIWGRVDWTDRAAEYLSNREYRFISPTFTYEKDTRALHCLVGAGLTNRPALTLTALAKDQIHMDRDQAQAELRELLGLSGDAGLDAVVESVRTLTQQTATAAAQPDRFVPIDVFEQVTAQLNQLSQGVSAEAAAICVDREIAAGRVVPALREWAVSLCTSNKPAFDGFVQRTSGSLKQLFAVRLPGGPPGRVTAATSIDEEVAGRLGLSAEAVASANGAKL